MLFLINTKNPDFDLVGIMKNKKLVKAFTLFALAASAMGVNAIEVYPLDPSQPSYVVVNNKKLVYGQFKTMSEADQLEIKKTYARSEAEQLKRQYSPKASNELILPVDIADIRLKKTKHGYRDKFRLVGERDALSVFLAQSKQAAHYLGLYQQRRLAWHQGKPDNHITVEQAINREVMFDFMKIELDSSQTSVDQLNYLDRRLSTKHADIVRSWTLAHADHSTKSTVLDILTQHRVQAKLEMLGN